MKIAVFVYGEYRDFDILVKTWKFLKDLDCDVYVSTWDYSYQENHILGYFVEKHVTKEMILDLIPDAKVMVINEKEHYGENYGYIPNPQKIAFHSKNCLAMAKQSGIQYDQAIWTRTDNYCKFNFSYEEFYSMNKPSTIYGLDHLYLSGPNEFFIHDVFFISKYDIMVNLIDTLPLDIMSIHNQLASHILKLNLYVEPIGHKLDFSTVRGNIQELTSIELLNIHKVREKTFLWNDSLYKHKKKIESENNN
jgi:hypothetical protein